MASKEPYNLCEFLQFPIKNPSLVVHLNKKYQVASLHLKNQFAEY